MRAYIAPWRTLLPLQHEQQPCQPFGEEAVRRQRLGNNTHAPLSADNDHGVLMAPAPATTYSGALRVLVAPTLAAFLGPSQQGVVPHGGIEFVLPSAPLVFAAWVQK